MPQRTTRSAPHCNFYKFFAPKCIFPPLSPILCLEGHFGACTSTTGHSSCAGAGRDQRAHVEGRYLPLSMEVNESILFSESAKVRRREHDPCHGFNRCSNQS